jgi:hypothetical protein
MQVSTPFTREALRRCRTSPGACSPARTGTLDKGDGCPATPHGGRLVLQVLIVGVAVFLYEAAGYSPFEFPASDSASASQSGSSWASR